RKSNGTMAYAVGTFVDIEQPCTYSLSTPTTVSGTIDTGPSIASWRDVDGGQAYVAFAGKASNGHLLVNTYRGSWAGWVEILDGAMMAGSDPAGVIASDGGATVFVRGTDSALYKKTGTLSGTTWTWSGWGGGTGKVFTSPGAGAGSSGAI